MQIKKTIILNGNDTMFQIPLSSNCDTIGSDNDVKKISSSISNDLINPIVDNEVKRITYATGVTNTIVFNYYNYTGTTYSTSLIYSNNFTQAEYDSYDPKLLNSFYIFDVFDSPNVLNQNRIYRTYLSKIHADNAFVISNRTNQFNSIFIPSYLLNASGSTTYYGRFMFYNAKLNKVLTFNNQLYVADTITTRKMTFEIIVNNLTKTWYFADGSAINAIEIVQTNNNFTTKVNNSVTGFEVKKPEYTAGTAFDYKNINYY
jgi:hypothetical protein